MDNFLNQREIDELIEAINNNSLSEWEIKRERSRKRRFKTNEIYTVEDYDLFYCSYKLEELTTCNSILRRYAYLDNKTFKEFKYFIVLEDYHCRGINAVAVVGILSNMLYNLNYNYDYYIENGKVYLVDATSLIYVNNFSQ